MLSFCIPAMQAQEFVYRNYVVKDGLPSSEVYSAVQDNKGYIWFASDAGISKFDGYTFKNFSTEEGLPDNAVLGLHLDRKGRIWFRTWVGYFGYITAEEKIVIVPASKSYVKQKFGSEIIVSMYMDKEENLWIGTESGNSFYKITPPYKEKNFTPISLEHNLNYCSMIDENGIIYGSSTGILPGSGEVKLRNVLYQREKFLKNLTPAKRTTRYCFLNPDSSISFYVQNEELKIKNNKVITTQTLPGIVLYRLIDKDNNNWTAVFKKGVWLNHDKQSPYIPNNFLSESSVSCVIQDREGGYWITTLERGIFYLPSLNLIRLDSKSGLEENKILRVRCFGTDSFAAETNVGNIIIYENGKITIHKADENHKLYNKTPQLKYPEKRILISTRIRTWIYYYGDKCLRHMNNQNNDAFVTRTALELQEGKLYSLSNYLNALDLKKHKGSTIRALSDRMVCSLKDSKGTIWLGGLQGLYTLNNLQESKYLKDPKLAANRIEEIAENKNGVIAFATRGAGLILMKNNRCVYVDTKDGLASNICKSVVADENGRFWIGTNKGISVLEFHDSARYHINNFFVDEQHVYNEVNKLSIWKNTLWISTNSGIIRLMINETILNNVPPMIYITNYTVNSKTQPDLNLKTFTPDSNYFVINYSGISFHDLGYIKYKYKMEGLDTTWRYTENKNIQYTSLQPGKYSFIIYAINRNGIASEKPATLSFIIAKPFWQTGWFILAVSLLIALCVFIIVQIRTKQIHSREEQKTKFNKKIAETELKALRAQMNPHFIFNAINSIQNFILKNDSDNAQLYLSRFSKLIRNVLENSEHEEISIAQEIETLELYMQIELLRFNFKFNFNVIVDDQIDKMTKIPGMIIQPFLENAIWHGLMHKEGERNLFLEIRKEDHNLIQCIIDDDGIGRDEAMKINSKRTSFHTSMGTQITRDRLDILNKQYGLHTSVLITDKTDKNNKPSGTRVEIYIPIKQ